MKTYVSEIVTLKYCVLFFYYGLSHLTRFFICHIKFFWGNYVDILSLQCTISNKISSNENIKLNKKESEHQD